MGDLKFRFWLRPKYHTELVSSFHRNSTEFAQITDNGISRIPYKMHYST